MVWCNGGFVTLEDGTKAEVDGIQELEIALTAMANCSIKGSEAGTHMRNMLLKLASPTAEGAEAFQNLGVKVFDAQGKMRSLKDIFGDLNTSLGKLTQQEKLQAISEIFNTRDTSSSVALLDAIGQDWDHIGESILNAQGAAEQMAETQLDNLAGDITTLKSAFEETKITISDMLAPTLRDFVQTGTRELRNMTEAFQANGFRGLFTIIRLDIEQAQRHIEGALPDLLEKGKQLVGKIAEGIENNAGAVGEKTVTLLTNIGTKLTDPDAFSKVSGFAKTVFDNFVAGLLSDESLDKLGDPETGVVKIIENIGENLKESAVNLMDSATKIIKNLGDYLNDEENRKQLKETAKGIMKKIAEGLTDPEVKTAIGGLIVEGGKLIADIFIGGIDWEATGSEIIKQIVRGMIHNVGAIGRFIGETIEGRVNEDMYAFLEEDTTSVYQQTPQVSTLRGSYSRTNESVTSRSLTGAGFTEYQHHLLGYASGFYANRPAYLTNSIVGEAGDEVLLPLDSNTAWMDKLAEKLGDRMQTGGVTIGEITINVTGTEDIGREVVEQIDTALRQYQIMQQRGVAGWAR